MLTRRHAVLGTAACALHAALPRAVAQTTPRTAPPAAPLPKVKLYIPANPGGGWDQTGRSLGRAPGAGGMAQQVDYENKGGKGGTLGLADFVARYGEDPGALLIGGMVMVGAIAVNRSEVTLKAVTPIAR